MLSSFGSSYDMFLCPRNSCNIFVLALKGKVFVSFG